MDGMNFSSPKTCRSLTAECSLPPFLSWSEAILLDPKILRVDLTKFHFQSQQPITKKKKKRLMEMPALFVIFHCLTGYELASGFWDCFAESSNTNMT